MKTAIIGGGPAGLYFAILLKKLRPEADITVYERNRADETFGFGVVFSDATLDNFEKYDLPSYQRITREFAYWDDIAIHFRGTEHRIGGNGFCGCSRRTLLLILQDRAEELGVRLRYEADVDDESLFADADLVVVADGINSRFRERYADHFQPEVDLRPNKFTWMGSTKPLDAFTFIFQETEWGPFIAHAYQYEANRSTWVFETDPETFERAGLDDMSEAESAALMEQIFGWFLGGHRVLTNRSIWRNFPMIRNKRWVMGNKVLLGDAKASAHFSIGSGTKLAMEDAIALYEAFRRDATCRGCAVALRDRAARGGREDPARGRRVPRLVRARGAVLGFRSGAVRLRRDDPRQGDHLRQPAPARAGLRGRRRPDLREAGARAGLRRFGREPEPPDVPALPAARHGDAEPRRGLADGHVFGERRRTGRLASRALRRARHGRCGSGLHRDDLHLAGGSHHAWLHGAVERRAGGGLEADRRFRPCQLGREVLPAARAFRPQGRDQAHVGGHGPAAGGGRLGRLLRIAHSLFPGQPGAARSDARRHGSSSRRSSSRRQSAASGPASTCSNCIAPTATCSRASSRRSPTAARTNTAARSRTGCAFRSRYSTPCARSGLRRSRCRCASPPPTGPRAASPATTRSRSRAPLPEHGVDLVDVSTGQTVREARPIYGRMFQTPFSDQVRNEAQVATMCVGNITTADQVNTILAAGRADLVALGRPHLVDPFFTMKAAAWYGAKDIHCPPQYLAGKDQIFRNSRPRPAGSRRAEGEGEAEDPGGAEDGGRRETSRGGMR